MRTANECQGKFYSIMQDPINTYNIVASTSRIWYPPEESFEEDVQSGMFVKYMHIYMQCLFYINECALIDFL